MWRTWRCFPVLQLRCTLILRELNQSFIACLFKGSQENSVFLQTPLFTAFIVTVLKFLTYALVSTWSLVSSRWEHVKRKMYPWEKTCNRRKFASLTVLVCNKSFGEIKHGYHILYKKSKKHTFLNFPMNFMREKGFLFVFNAVEVCPKGRAFKCL